MCRRLSPYIFMAILWLSFFAVLSVVTINAQSGGGTTGSIFGSVKDEQGAVINGASVTVKDMETNLEYSCTTKDDGSYQLFHMRPGNYQIKAAAAGFVMQTLNIRLLLGIIAVNDNVLPVDETREVINVTTNFAIGGSADKTESSTNITTEKIETLPIIQRNFLDF